MTQQPTPRDGVRVRLIRGFYDGPRAPVNYRPYMIWCGGDPVSLGAMGTVQRAPPELCPGPKHTNGDPWHWPWCVVWDEYPARPGWYFGIGDGYRGEELKPLPYYLEIVEEPHAGNPEAHAGDHAAEVPGG